MLSAGCPTRRLPVFDMIDVSDLTCPGWRIASSLSDHPAHRGADYMGRRECELAQEARRLSSAMSASV